MTLHRTLRSPAPLAGPLAIVEDLLAQARAPGEPAAHHAWRRHVLARLDHLTRTLQQQFTEEEARGHAGSQEWHGLVFRWARGIGRVFAETEGSTRVLCQELRGLAAALNRHANEDLMAAGS